MARAPAAKEQETCAVAWDVVDRIGQHLQIVFPGRLKGGDRAAKSTSPHHPGRISGGTGGQLKGCRKVVGEPLAALGKGLGMGEHLTDPRLGPTAQQRMANRQHQGPQDSEISLFPEGI